MSEELGRLLADVAAGRPPPPDATVEVWAPPAEGGAAILAFAAHHVVAADVDPAWVQSQLPAGDLSAPLGGPFVVALAQRLHLRIGNLDAVLAAPALAGDPALVLDAVDDAGHPRVARARRHRADVRVWKAGTDGVLAVGRGLAGRWEAALEVEPAARGRGLGRALAAAARHLVPPGEHVWLQVAPGNVPSLRAVLAAGYAPVGAEILLSGSGGDPDE